MTPWRENRSQIVFTTARGRDAVFWPSARTRKQARPQVRTPTARTAGIAELEIVVDSHEQYPYRFANQQVRTLAEEWTYRYLAAAHAWACAEPLAVAHRHRHRRARRCPHSSRTHHRRSPCLGPRSRSPRS